MIELRHLRKDFSSQVAVRDVSLRIASGRKLVLLGPSGCGKTTLLRMINRLVTPSAGSVWFNGSDTATLDPVALRRRIGYVLQGAGLLPHRTARENILTLPRLLGWPQAQCDERLFVIKALLWIFDDWLDAYPHELSGGQKQRVALARALITDPPVILMDEPFGALDPVTRPLLRREFRALWALRDKTIVLVTHDITEAIEFGEHIALMSEGLIEQVGTPAQLLFQPKNAFVRRFFDGERLQHEWHALRLSDLPLSADVVPDGARQFRLGLPAHTTMAEAMAASGDHPVRCVQLLAAFQACKTAAPRAPLAEAEPT